MKYLFEKQIAFLEFFARVESHFFKKIIKKFGIHVFHVNIWNQYDETFIKMNTNKPMFGAVILLKTLWYSWTSQESSFHCVVAVNAICDYYAISGKH